MKIRWLGNHSFFIEAEGKKIIVDPSAGSESDYAVADIIIITQWHFAHCNLGLARKCIGDHTHVLGTAEVASQIFPCSTFTVGDRRKFDNIEVFCMPVNNPRPGIRDTKPRSQVGFVLHAENKKVYFISDSDFIEGMEKVLPDVLLIPVGGTVTLDARQAAGIAKLISPKLAVPVMWGGFVGSRDDAENFCRLCDVDCRVIPPGEVLSL